jgi:serine/threonine protein kinase HipA of HipAB toxin-antitoxin module
MAAPMQTKDLFRRGITSILRRHHAAGAAAEVVAAAEEEIAVRLHEQVEQMREQIERDHS